MSIRFKFLMCLKMPIYQDVIINPYLASSEPTTPICLTETTEVIEDEKFKTCLTRNYIFTKKNNLPSFMEGSTFVWREAEKSQIYSLKTFLAILLCCLWQYSYDMSILIYVFISNYFLFPLIVSCRFYAM